MSLRQTSVEERAALRVFEQTCVAARRGGARAN
jgi:hypothetical protein